MASAGTHDMATTVDQGRFLAEAGHDGTLTTLPGAHLSNVECAEAFPAAVLAWLGHHRTPSCHPAAATSRGSPSTSPTR